MTLSIGVDVGGTKIAAGLVDSSGHIVMMLRRPTIPNDSQSVRDTIIDLCRQLQQENEVEAVGIGAAGFVDSSGSTVIFAPNVSWRNEPIAEQVSQAIDMPVVVENDANAAAWAEYRFGAAAGFSSAVVVTVGTGIGGGIILNGELLRGSYGFAGEIGHINMVRDGRECGCGQRGCWEVYSSGRALLAAAQEQARTCPEIAAGLLRLADGDPQAITGLMVTQAAQEGCCGARNAFAEIGYWLGQGMADVAALLDPDVFVLAGGVCEAGDLLLEPTRQSFTELLTGRAYRPLPPIRVATLGNQAGIIGAADLARRAA
ncbi:ROK family glucokinase [Trueperella sp. LYQ143]|uniref:ROK family glucokinase n=1 Tax=unclassified Trueperella TaxID=2630174 RepID=UPI00398357F9